jgi:hypothetical protein
MLYGQHQVQLVPYPTLRVAKIFDNWLQGIDRKLKILIWM